MRRLRTYNQVWQVEKTIYAIEGMSLPVPVSFRQMGFFIGALLLMMVLHRFFPPVAWFPYPIVKFIGVPLFVAWFATRKTLDGKAPHRFFWRLLLYWLLPKLFSRYKKMPVYIRPIRYHSVVVYREHGVWEGGEEDACISREIF